MLRSEVIQLLLDLFPNPRYLEIGVDHGVTFLPLRAKYKVAVDPKFHFDTSPDLSNPDRLAYHETTSDDYFSRLARTDRLFDVIFLDGLHTFDQTLRDLMNATMFLQPRGIIVVDDVIPNSYHASLASTDDLVKVRSFLATHDPRLQEDQAWMGDVYKIPFYVQSYMPQFSYATTSDNHGQTVLWRHPRPPGQYPERTVEAISRLEFKDFVRHHDALKLTPARDIVHAIQAASDAS